MPTYNPGAVYGTWPNASYPPVYLPPSPGEQFTNSLVKGLGFSLGVATTYAIFSNIDWDHDDDWDHHHHDDYHGGYNHNGDNNININVDNFNKISGQHLTEANRTWQHNPAFRGGILYATDQLNNHFHPTNTAVGLSSTRRTAMDRDTQRQAALAQMEKSTGKPLSQHPANQPGQRQAVSQQLKQISQRNNYRGYDTDRQHHAERATIARPEQKRPATQHQPVQQSHSRALNVQQRANALSGNDSRSASWQAQQQRGMQSIRHLQQRPADRDPLSQRGELREFRHR